MGNNMRPGTVVIREADHEKFELLGVPYTVRELAWNGITGHSYDLVRLTDDAILTEEESFDHSPTDGEIIDVLESNGVPVDLIMQESCKFCGGRILRITAHRHAGGRVGDNCCWDERLRSRE